MGIEEKTTKQIKTIKKYLKQKYGAINKEWEISLDTLESSMRQFYWCEEELKQNGDIVQGRYGPMINPAATLKDKAQIRIEKMMSEFGLGAKSAMKLKADSDDTEDFIDDLTS